ncbi:restriction endonuclease subunit S [Enterococcus faecalis]|uniref:restriction endonuclease subunit S n=1 Tax=Enterococcus faecalis TaxID=1351 RepID=UPI0013718E22|nr:restriction endonuclease subunit S [Enterococcus faecalis]ELZ4623901.1 restriction endonuclease subunit S [Enterococcus faecalis]NAA52137.1 restriction endonuclease subunit S [Enterococcus faecalis]
MENLFNYNWELCKVGDFGREIYGGGTPKTSVKEFWSGTLPWIQSSDLKEDKVCDIKAKKHISVKAIQQSSAKKISKNSIAIVTRVSVGKLVLMPYEYATSQDFLSISVLQVDKWFGVYSLYNKLQSELNSVQGTSIKGITKDELLNKKIMIPKPLKEQSKIGLFLKKIDTTIALHQRKLDQLKELKKAYLQVMFPAKDETVPRMRFAYFEGEWELCKLGDFLIVPPKIKATIDNPSDLMTVKLNLGGVYSGASRDTLSLGSTIYYKRFSGQFIYGKQNFFNGSMAIIPKELHGKATSGDVPSFDIININKDYLFYFISRKSYWKSKEVEATGTGSKRIHEKTLQNFSILVPLKDEQIRISTFCEKIDDTITLHQNKLNQLKSLKKSYLQNMFI